MVVHPKGSLAKGAVCFDRALHPGKGGARCPAPDTGTYL